jgi:DNA-binding XRE family transcriptional regulator
MIRKLGAENFKWEVLEDDIPEKELNKKEVYYIRKYNSYEDGYNSNMGGKTTHTVKLTKTQVAKIRKYLKETDLSMVDIAKKFPNCTREMISDINCGETWFYSDIDYPIREQGFNKQINFSEDQIFEIIDLLQNSDLGYKAISNKFNCHPNTIKKISEGDTYHLDGIDYPIRKKCFSHLTEDQVLKTAELLKTTSLLHREIADRLGIPRKTIVNINVGKYHQDILLEKGYTFPIRKKK